MNISKVFFIAASLVTLTSVNALASSRNPFEECSFDAKYCDSGSKVSTEIVTSHGHAKQSKNVQTYDQSSPLSNGNQGARTGHDNAF
jgi:hypothetical protein